MANHIPDLYSTGCQLALDEVESLTGQSSNPSVTDLFQPADHNMFIFVGVRVFRCPDLIQTFLQNNNLFSGDGLPNASEFLGVSTLEASQLFPVSTNPSATDPLSPPCLSSSFEGAPDSRLNNPANLSPSTTTAVTSLLSSFHDRPDTALTTAPPNASNKKSYPRNEDGRNILVSLLSISYFFSRIQSFQVHQGTHEANANIFQTHEEN